MAAHGARRLLPMAENAMRVIGIELLAAAQGCDFHAPLDSSAPLEAVRALLRARGAASRRRPPPAPDIAGGDRARRARARSIDAAAASRCPVVAERRRDDDRAAVADGRARRRAAGRQPAAYRHRDPRRRSSAAASRPGWRARTPTGGSTSSTTSPRELGATIVRTAISRTVIDVNRDPSGASLYPGQARRAVPDHRPSTASRSTGRAGARTRRRSPARRARISSPITPRSRPRSRGCAPRHRRVVLYDCHSIRSRHPPPVRRRAAGFQHRHERRRELRPGLAADDRGPSAPRSGFSHVVNGRFKGGWITRHYGDPASGVHAVQMELACRGYMQRAAGPVVARTWPTPYDAGARGADARGAARILKACARLARATPLSRDRTTPKVTRRCTTPASRHDPHRQCPHHPRRAPETESPPRAG